MNGDIIHKASEVDFDTYSYSKLYAETLSTVDLNGEEINIPPSMIIEDININTISAVNTVYCIGTKKSSLSAPNPDQGYYL